MVTTPQQSTRYTRVCTCTRTAVGFDSQSTRVINHSHPCNILAYTWYKHLSVIYSSSMRKSTYLVHTRRFAQSRVAYAARDACSGGKNSVKRKKQSPCLIVSEKTGDLKMPRAPPPCSRKITHRHHVYRVCIYLVFCCICDVCMCLSRSLCLYSALVARMTNRHGH